MLEILQFYVSGFWVWLGLTFALAIVTKGVIVVFALILATLSGKNLTWED